MKTKSTWRILPLFGSLLIVVIVLVTAVYKNRQMNESLNTQKLKSEVLLAEKLNLDKSIGKMKNELTESKNSNGKLKQKIYDIQSEMLAKNSEINQLKVRTANFETMKQKNSEMEQSLGKLNSEIGKLNDALKTASTENGRLSNQLQTASQKNEGLSSDNTILKAMFSDNYRTEASRGKKDKLTVNAHRTNKLSVSFDIPANIPDKLYFKVTTPNGQEFSSKTDIHASITINDLGDALLASTSEIIGSSGKKRVEMSYRPDKKLQEGIYQFNLYNEDRFLGSTQLRLK